MSRLEKCDLCEGRGTDALHRWCATCKGSGKVFSFVAEPTAPPAPFVPVALGSIPPVKRWECGKCTQEELATKGLPIGEVIPEHFRTCPKRTSVLPTVPLPPAAKIKASNPKDAIGSGLKDSGTRREFATGSKRDAATGKGRYDLLSPIVMAADALLMEKGAVKYDARNWELGQPVSAFFDCAVRHLYKHLAGWRDEDHLAAARWNIGGILHVEHQIARGKLPDALLDWPEPYVTEEDVKGAVYAPKEPT